MFWKCRYCGEIANQWRLQHHIQKCPALLIIFGHLQCCATTECCRCWCMMYWLAPAWASCLSFLLGQVLRVGTVYEKVLQPTKYLLDFKFSFLHWFCRWALRPGQIIFVGFFDSIVGTSYHYITWLFGGGFIWAGGYCNQCIIGHSFVS